MNENKENNNKDDTTNIGFKQNDISLSSDKVNDPSNNKTSIPLNNTDKKNSAKYRNIDDIDPFVANPDFINEIIDNEKKNKGMKELGLKESNSNSNSSFKQNEYIDDSSINPSIQGLGVDRLGNVENLNLNMMINMGKNILGKLER